MGSSWTDAFRRRGEKGDTHERSQVKKEILHAGHPLTKKKKKKKRRSVGKPFN